MDRMDLTIVKLFWFKNGAVTKEGNVCFCTKKTVLLNYTNFQLKRCPSLGQRFFYAVSAACSLLFI